MIALLYALWNQGIYYGRMFATIFVGVATLTFLALITTISIGGFAPAIIPLMTLVLGLAPIVVFWWDPVVVVGATWQERFPTVHSMYGAFASATGVIMLGINLLWFFGAGEAGRGPMSATAAFCGCAWAFAYLLLGHTSLRRGALTAILGTLVVASLIVLAYQVEKRDAGRRAANAPPATTGPSTTTSTAATIPHYYVGDNGAATPFMPGSIVEPGVMINVSYLGADGSKATCRIVGNETSGYDRWAEIGGAKSPVTHYTSARWSGGEWTGEYTLNSARKTSRITR